MSPVELTVVARGRFGSFPIQFFSVTVSIFVLAACEASSLAWLNEPIAVPQSTGVSYNTPTAVTLSGTLASGSPLASGVYTIISSPSHGSLSGSAPNLTYTPTNEYYGSDSFTFTASDGTLTSTPATVNIAVSELQITLTYVVAGSPYTNANIFTDAQNAALASPAWDGTTPAVINVTINSGVTIGSSSTSTAALVTNAFGSQSFPTGTMINVTNGGTIAGAGGDGGWYRGYPVGGSGNNGGNAFSIAYPITLTNIGLIAGGGGGADDNYTGDQIGGPGGGGAGTAPGTSPTNANSITGSSGTATLGGAGATDFTAGAAGGNLGYSGSTSGTGGTGGAAGFAMTGTDLISNNWSSSENYLGHDSNTGTGSSHTYGAATTFSIISGNNQNGGAKGRTLGLTLVVQLNDSVAALAGIPITWTVNGTAIASCSATTDASGKATCSSIVTGSNAATNTIVATAATDVGNLTATFTALSNSVCTGGTVTAGATCNGSVSNNVNGAKYAGDFNGYEYIAQAADTGLSVWSFAGATTNALDLNDGATNTSTLQAYYGMNFAADAIAANLCYSIGDNGWYLPAVNELKLLFQNRAAIGGFTSGRYYWSSTESSNANVQAVRFLLSGPINSFDKTNSLGVRCLRRF